MSTQPAGGSEAAAETELSDDGRVRVWFVRLAEALPFSPVWAALGFTAAIAALVELVPPLVVPAPPRTVLVFWAGIVGYVFATAPYAEHLAAQTLDALRPSLGCSEEAFLEARRSVLHHDRRALVLSALAATAWGLVINEAMGGQVSRILAGDRAMMLEWRGWLLVLGWVMVGPTAYIAFSNARTLGRAGRWLDVSLIERRPGGPLVRFGSTVALLWVLAVATGVLLAFSSDTAPPGADRAVLFVGQLFSIAIAVAAFTLPLTGLRERIREEKARELERVGAALGGDRDALSTSPMANRAGDMGVADLLAWQREVEQYPEWPFGANERVRLLAYALLPALSWIAAALVERAIDALL